MQNMEFIINYGKYETLGVQIEIVIQEINVTWRAGPE